jgi:hypothetical protein
MQIYIYLIIVIIIILSLYSSDNNYKKKDCEDFNNIILNF